ncbi:hypothetical protein Hanom_Chr11g01021171 [Helianthus anomalus]
MFVCLTKRMKFLVCVRLFNKRTNINELPAELFTNCSPNIWFICSRCIRCHGTLMLTKSLIQRGLNKHMYHTITIHNN